MRMHGFSELSIASGGTLPNAFKAAYVGPAPQGETFIGPVLTTQFTDGTGPVATYSDLRDGVRYGWPLMFALGWAGSYLFWKWRWKKTGRLSGLGSVKEKARTYERWTHAYARKHGVPIKVLADYSDDTAHTMLRMITEDGMPPYEAYSAIVDASQRARDSVKTLPAMSIRGLRGSPADHLRRYRELRANYPKTSPMDLIRADEEAMWFSPRDMV